MSLTHKTDYLAASLKLLPGQYQGKPRMEAVVEAFANEAQAAEDAMWDVFTDRLLQNNAATGDLLDKLGKIVGQPRNSMLDPEYLILITARIAANRSDGRRESLIRLAGLLVPGASIYVKDFPPCSVYVAPQAPITIDPYIAAQFMEVAAAAGIELVFAWTPVALADTIIGGSIYAPGFTAGPAPTNTGVTSSQSPGSIYHASFAAGPIVASDGGGTLSGVVQSQGEA